MINEKVKFVYNSDLEKQNEIASQVNFDVEANDKWLLELIDEPRR